MDAHAKTLEELSQKASRIGSQLAVVGLDGFIDSILSAVDQRHGLGEAFTPISTLDAFGNRIAAAAGKSTNIELFPRMDKLGGNGPIMANALSAAGSKVRYIGALGKESIHPVFEDFAQKTDPISLADPSLTAALEFEDGKLMLGQLASLEGITFDRLLEVAGEGMVHDLFNRADLVAMVNWTMVPHFGDFLTALLDKVYPNLGPGENRHFFFDLADPEKRSDDELRGALATFKRFLSHGRVTLGLNLKEGQRIAGLFGIEPSDDDPAALQRMTQQVREAVGLSCVVIHPTNGAACATREGVAYAPGPFCAQPKITTGAGDHFNAGFMAGQLVGLSAEASLTVAVSTSGYYVRTARSPSLTEISTFIRNWPES